MARKVCVYNVCFGMMLKIFLHDWSPYIKGAKKNKGSKIQFVMETSRLTLQFCYKMHINFVENETKTKHKRMKRETGLEVMSKFVPVDLTHFKLHVWWSELNYRIFRGKIWKFPRLMRTKNSTFCHFPEQ